MYKKQYFTCTNVQPPLSSFPPPHYPSIPHLYLKPIYQLPPSPPPHPLHPHLLSIPLPLLVYDTESLVLSRNPQTCRCAVGVIERVVERGEAGVIR